MLGCCEAIVTASAGRLGNTLGGESMGRRLIVCLAVVSAMVAVWPLRVAQAAGFQVTESSISGAGYGFAGLVAGGEDASALFFNPAGIAYLNDAQVLLGLHSIRPTVTFTDAGSTTLANTALTGEAGRSDATGVAPNFYYVRPVGAQGRFGLGVSAPFGLTTDYGEDWVGRYHATKSQLQTININPVFSYRASDKVALGIGLNAQYAKISLANRVDSFSACANVAGQLGQDVATACGDLTGPSIAANDGDVELDGQAWSFGFNAGIVFSVNDKTRVGFSFRQGMRHRFDGGSADFNISAACAVNPLCVAATVDSPIRANMALPDIAILGFRHQVADRLTLLGDVTWHGWDTLDAVIVEFEDGSGRDNRLEFGWANTLRYGLGLVYDYGHPWTFRAGVAFDESPSQTVALNTPRVPDGDRATLSLGVGYVIDENFTLDAAYTRLFVDDMAIANVQQGHTLNGRIELSAQVFSIQARYRF